MDEFNRLVKLQNRLADQGLAIRVIGKPTLAPNKNVTFAETEPFDGYVMDLVEEGKFTHAYLKQIQTMINKIHKTGIMLFTVEPSLVFRRGPGNKLKFYLASTPFAVNMRVPIGRSVPLKMNTIKMARSESDYYELEKRNEFNYMNHLESKKPTAKKIPRSVKMTKKQKEQLNDIIHRTFDL
jgi:hypothetical protein